MSKLKNQEFKALWEKAMQAGSNAAAACTPTPMAVQETGLFGKFDHKKPYEVVMDGVCGFAWVQIKPGNTAFANWLKKMNYARPDSYYGGVSVWIGDYNQSMQRKEAHAGAMARVFSEAGYNAYMMSRMD